MTPQNQEITKVNHFHRKNSQFSLLTAAAGCENDHNKKRGITLIYCTMAKSDKNIPQRSVHQK